MSPVFRQDGTRYYNLTDHLSGNSIDIREDGTILSVSEYTPYGDMRISVEDDTHTNTYKYTGKELDKHTGLYYYGARYYDPETTRFVSLDPAYLLIGEAEAFEQRYKRSLQQHLSDPQGLHAYAYARNNPVVYSDANGEIFALIPAVIAAFEFLSTAYDVAHLVDTYVDPNSTNTDKQQALEFVAIGVTMPGSGKMADEIFGFSSNAARRMIRSPRVHFNGKDVPVYRGGTRFDVRRGTDIETNNGMVKPNSGGISVNANPNDEFVQAYGGAYEITALPDGLQFSKPNATGHVLIEPAHEMTFSEYQDLVNKIETKAYDGD